MKTVVYRPQANRTERVNRDLVQMIANYVNVQHDTWDQFLREFAYAIRTAVNETTRKTPAVLFLGRKLITPFQKLVMVSDGTEFAVGDCLRRLDETQKLRMKNGRNIIIDTGVMCKKRSGGPERKVQNGSEYRVHKRTLSSNDTNSILPKNRKKSRTEKTVTPTTSGYNLRPRNGKGMESTIERKTQQGGPVRSRKGRGRNDSPYIEERTRSSNKNARRGGDQQRQGQERRGACTKKSLSLEVLLHQKPCLARSLDLVPIEDNLDIIGQLLHHPKSPHKVPSNTWSSAVSFAQLDPTPSGNVVQLGVSSPAPIRIPSIYLKHAEDSLEDIIY
ncbi:uncharacterized protein TNCV_581131 [Trichonephila clavipes]|nr:uncharacterized protein TNCV_581131 [Trichonephila clavipes]